MDIPECTVSTVHSTTPPPSYIEASQCPAYVAGTAPPSTPPPSYVEAVGEPNGIAPSPYPVLNIPTQIMAVHQIQQVLVEQTVHSAPPQVRVVSQQEFQRRLGDTPTVTTCPYCRHNITTVVDYKPGAAAWGVCCLLTLLGLICGCCLIPFCITALHDVHHTCPFCNRHIGICVR
ncbi:lipopolysaccharide-induced tumor necrosis factor-alpha factor homolog [Salminus brasiliensis]|uniref:lipopolysaccharide-induced tumor necrosis factor-alpha factor homolog n=1 Tax=Salminus brasiliensis TaxID=930266 RepID=UPI003B83416E